VCEGCRRQGGRHGVGLDYTPLDGPAELNPPADPWADTGYQPHDTGPHPAPGPVVCPWCGRSAGHDVNTSPTGGLICGTCGNQFADEAGAAGLDPQRRALWVEATRGDAA
jgi:hypothetical protein